MKALYLIPARGGSKGVPGKNIRLLGGKPLIAHSIGHALEVADREDVVVSTDSEEIKGAALEAGARVPFLRPAELASDTAGSREVMLHAIDYLSAKGENYDTIVLLQPTSPLRDPADIRRAVEIYKESGADMVVSVAEARTNPYYNAFETDNDGFLKISKGDGSLTRRQDAPKVWEFTGAIYVIKVSALREKSITKFDRILPLPTKRETAIDIDEEMDFLVCEEMIKKRKNGNAAK